MKNTSTALGQYFNNIWTIFAVYVNNTFTTFNMKFEAILIIFGGYLSNIIQFRSQYLDNISMLFEKNLDILWGVSRVYLMKYLNDKWTIIGQYLYNFKATIQINKKNKNE